MKYDRESIEKRVNTVNKIVKITRKILWVIVVIVAYNIFLISKSSLSGR